MGGVLAPSHFNILRTGGLAARPGSCRKIAGRNQNSRKRGIAKVRVSMAPDKSGRAVAPKTDHAVVIAGGGPTGLMLAGELALARADVAIVERRAAQDLI